MAVFGARSGEPSRRQLALQGAVVLGVVVALLVTLVLKLNGVFSDRVPVTAQLESAGGAIRSGVDVKMRGMVVGKVVSVEGDATQVRLGLELDKDQVDKIPGQVRARVLPASVFGTSYVDLVLSGSGREPIRADATITQDTSATTLELQTALDSIDTLVDALGPAELATALHTLSTVLDGRGQELGEALDTLNGYTTRFAPLIPRLRGDLRLLAVNLDAVARNAPELLDATDDALVSLGNLVDRREQLTTALDSGLTLMQEANRFLVGTERDFLDALSMSVTLVDTLYDERNGLRDTLTITGTTSAKLLSVLEDGYARVEGYVRVSGPGDYTRADCPRYGSLRGGNCG